MIGIMLRPSMNKAAIAALHTDISPLPSTVAGSQLTDAGEDVVDLLDLDPVDLLSRVWISSDFSLFPQRFFSINFSLFFR